MYSRSTVHSGNSLILFYPNGDNTLSPVPGQITDIIRIGRTTELRVQRQLIVNRNTPNPFEKYPHFPASLYHASLDFRTETVQLNWITAHYARYPWSDNEVVVLSLSRVSSFVFDLKFVMIIVRSEICTVSVNSYWNASGGQLARRIS